MSVSTIDCRQFDDLFSDYLEGTLSLPSRAAVDAHVVSCARCGSLLADVRSIVDRAGSLPVLQPSRDLWSGIAEKIDAPVVPIGTAATVQRRLRVPRWAGLAAAAAVLVVATSLVTREVTRSGFPDTPAIVELTPRPVTLPESLGNESTTAALRVSGAPKSEAHVREGASVTYGREIARLEAIVRQRESALDPATTAIIENSMRIIDSALVEARAALARDPASRFLTDQVDKTLQKKMELLRSVTMIAGT